MKLFLPLFLILFLLPAFSAQADVWQPSPGHVQVPLWPDAKAGPEPESMALVKDALVAGKPWVEVSHVSQPTMTVYAPPEKNTGAAVVVFPGGGYKILAIDLEGTEVCDWLNARGITCVLLKYRVPFSGPYWDDKCKCHITPEAPLALQDAQRAVGLVRFHAKEWHIDPHKIGVLGFSAGGHMSAEMGTQSIHRLYKPVDAADRESCRPDFAVALYPGHLWVDEKKFELSPTVPVTEKSSPVFLLQAEDDPVDSVNNALVYYIALKKAGVPVEMHLYAHGGHAFGLRPTKMPITGWPPLVEAWLYKLGMI